LWSIALLAATQHSGGFRGKADIDAGRPQNQSYEDAQAPFSFEWKLNGIIAVVTFFRMEAGLDFSEIL